MWCLVDSRLRYVYDFDIYYGRNGGDANGGLVQREEAILAHNIVMKLMDRHHHKGHCIVMDNYFISIGLFEELARNGTYATWTV